MYKGKGMGRGGEGEGGVIMSKKLNVIRGRMRTTVVLEVEMKWWWNFREILKFQELEDVKKAEKKKRNGGIEK